MERSLFANGCIVDARPTDLRASMVTNAVVSERAVSESCAKNVPFSVVSCSGQDEDFPASELNKGVVGRGWQSSRSCYYPQELVVGLQFPARVINMQLLCHEYKIPSKVEIYVGLTPESDQKRLGYFSLDPNDRSGHQARELKSIHVNSPASTVRLVLHSCYTNKLNVYNQVGLVALIITGDPITEQQLVQFQLEFSPMVQTPSTYEAASQESDISSISMSRSQDSSGIVPYRSQLTRVSDGNLSSVDSHTASRIRKLLQDKSAAVVQEDYDEAKRLKVLIEKLNVLGERIKELEIQKQSAVEEEDYDTAKMLKLEVEKLRQAGGGNQNGTRNYRGMPESGPVETAVTENLTAGLRTSEGNPKLMELPGAGSDTLKHSPDGRKSFDQIDVRHSIGTGHMPVMKQDGGPLLKQDIAAPLKQDSFTQPKATKQSANVSMPAIERPPVEPHQADDLIPEPLPEAVLKELGPVVSVIGKYRLECLYSKQWQLRDKTLQQLEKDMLQNQLNGDTFAAFRAINKVILRALGDKVSNVFHTSLQLLRSHVTKYAAEVPTRDLQTCVTDVAVILIEKMGDSNVRIKEDATKTVMFVTLKKEIGLPVMSPLLLKPAKSLVKPAKSLSEAIWKPILGRLQLLLVAVPMFGLQPQSRGGFNADALMAFVVQGFSSPNGDVRNAAVKVTTEVYKLMGLQVEKFLKGIKSAIREVLTANFEKVGSHIGSKGDESAGQPPETSPMRRRSLLMKGDQKALDMKCGKQGGGLMVEGQGKVRNSNEDLHPTTSSGKIADEQNRSTTKLHGQLSSSGEDSYGQVTQPARQGSPTKVRATKPRPLQQSGGDTPQIGFQQAQGEEVAKEEGADSCLFCGMQDRRFADGDMLDLHFCQKCPMLTGCVNCRQIVEIATLKEHFLYECTAGKRYLECQRCLQAIPEARVALHMKSKECHRSKHQKTTRCPLCHHTVQPGDLGWREHLLNPPRCAKNPRTAPQVPS